MFETHIILCSLSLTQWVVTAGYKTPNIEYLAKNVIMASYIVSVKYLSFNLNL